MLGIIRSLSLFVSAFSYFNFKSFVSFYCKLMMLWIQNQLWILCDHIFSSEFTLQFGVNFQVCSQCRFFPSHFVRFRIKVFIHMAFNLVRSIVLHHETIPIMILGINYKQNASDSIGQCNMHRSASHINPLHLFRVRLKNDNYCRFWYHMH